MTTVEQYRSTSLHLYNQAMGELDAGDLLQASEKLWGSAAQAMKCVAERRGWVHNSHAQFYNIMAVLEQEMDTDIRHGFDAASQLHINFYENRMTERQIRVRSEEVRSFIDELNRLDSEWQGFNTGGLDDNG